MGIIRETDVTGTSQDRCPRTPFGDDDSLLTAADTMRRVAKMRFHRNKESLIRQLLDVLLLVDESTPEGAILERLEQLQRGLEPENEFALILSWLGKCRLVHKLGQEQLPLNSSYAYRVPDLLAVFEHEGKLIPVLIEVKTTEPSDPTTLELGTLTLNWKYLAYAELLGLPMLVAWKHRGLWTLFEMRHAQLATVNYKIDFGSALKENLLGMLAGDFSYHLAPGTEIRMRIRKLTQPDPETDDFEGEVLDVHFANPAGEPIPSIRHLWSLFMFWDNEAEVVDEGDDVVQRFVVPDVRQAEFASRTLSQIVHAFAGLQGSQVSWRSIVHDTEHLAHDTGRMRALVEEGARYGVITDIWNLRPRSSPSFL
jgi:hypothetical protein